MSYNEIKESALNVFSEKGFDGTTIKDIAGGAGLKPSSIYSHISSKEELFIGIWNECTNKLQNSVRNLYVEAENDKNYDAEKVLYQYYSAVINYFTKNEKEYLFLKQATFLARNKEISEKIEVTTFLNNDRYIEYFGNMFKRLQEEKIITKGDYRELAFSFIALIIAFLEESIIYKIKLSENYMDKYWSIFTKGIKR